MSKNQLVNSQLDNYACYLMYRRQFITLAENVFIIDGLSTFCDLAYINKILLSRGQIAFFKDELIDKDGLLALPFTTVGPLDIYGRPQRIIVAGQNGYYRRLNKGEFVIMYDNNGRYSILTDVLAYAERMALATRVIDINLSNQKLPRVWKTKTGSEKTIKANLERKEKGKEPLKVKLDKGTLPSVSELVISEIDIYISDIDMLQKSYKGKIGKTVFVQDSVLKQLPLLSANSIDGVITSPPYCNRYDYTRIYALELVFLGKTESEINSLRQDLLSCTV